MEAGATLREPDKAVNGVREMVDNLVIGGGPAGSMVAMRLSAAGRAVVLLEREREAHHKVCGEFLSGEAVGYLRQAGIEPREIGASAITSVRLASGKRSVGARLPFSALSLSRLVLDEAMLKRAQEAGCEVRRGATAEGLKRRDSGWAVQLRGAETIHAKALFLATGKHDLRGRERRGGTQTDLVGFKMHWRLAPTQTEALRSVMELLLFRGGYGGLSLVEDEVANLCLVVRRKRLSALGGWASLVRSMCEELPLLRERLEDTTTRWTKPIAVSPIPYGYLGGVADGLWRVGDQTAVIPSFTGDGMSIALHSGWLAADMYLAGRSAEEYTCCVADQLRSGMRFASMLSKAMVTAGGRMAAPFLLKPLPRVIGQIASLTRIPERALIRSTRHENSPAQRPIEIA